MRVAQQRIAEEGDGSCYSKHHCSFYLPVKRKRRSDMIVGSIMMLALAYWTKQRGQNEASTASESGFASSSLVGGDG